MLRDALKKPYRPSFADLNVMRKASLEIELNVVTEGLLEDAKNGFLDAMSGLKNRWTMTWVTQDKVLQRAAVLELQLHNKSQLRLDAPDISLGGNFVSWLSLDGHLVTDAEQLTKQLLRIEEVCMLFQTAHIPAVLKLLKYVTEVFMPKAIINHEHVMYTHVPESKEFYPKAFDKILKSNRKDIRSLTKDHSVDIKCSENYLGEWFVASAIGDYNTCHYILPSTVLDRDKQHIDPTNGNPVVRPFTKKQVEIFLETMTRIIHIVKDTKKHTNYTAELDQLYQMCERYERAFTNSVEVTTYTSKGEKQNNRLKYWESEAAKPFMVAMSVIDELDVYYQIDSLVVGVLGSIMHLCEASVRMME